MKVETFNKLIEDTLTSFEKNIKVLINNNYTDTVKKKIKNQGRTVKSSLTRKYNKLNVELQAKVKNIYHDFLIKSDDIISQAIDTVSLNINTLRLYSYDLYKEIINNKI